MTLIIVDRSKIATYTRLAEEFVGDPNVRVIFDRRTKILRQRTEVRIPERRVQDRRRLVKPLAGRDYIVIHTAGGQ